MRSLLPLLMLLLGFAVVPVLAQDSKPTSKPSESKKPANPIVVVKTTHGEFEAELFSKVAPETVKNFIGLAEGTKPFLDQKVGKEVKRPFYDGLRSHRIIPNFMIQLGCPMGNGGGGPGYSFKDEISAKALGLDKKKAFKIENGQFRGMNDGVSIQPREMQQFIMPQIDKKIGLKDPTKRQEKMKEIIVELEKLTVKDCYEMFGYRFDDSLKSVGVKRGTLAMANSGANTNGSQFFVSTVDNLYLNGKHTVFGKVSKGMDVVDKIGKLGSRAGQPTETVKILSIRLKKMEAPKKK